MLGDDENDGSYTKRLSFNILLNVQAIFEKLAFGDHFLYGDELDNIKKLATEIMDIEDAKKTAHVR